MAQTFRSSLVSKSINSTNIQPHIPGTPQCTSELTTPPFLPIFTFSPQYVNAIISRTTNTYNNVYSFLSDRNTLNVEKQRDLVEF